MNLDMSSSVNISSASLIEKCIKVAGNKFDLVLLASSRTRDIDSGSSTLVNKSTDAKKKGASNKRSSLIALEEIANGLITKEELTKNMLKKIAREALHSNASMQEEIKAINDEHYEEILSNIEQENEAIFKDDDEIFDKNEADFTDESNNTENLSQDYYSLIEQSEDEEQVK